MKLTLIIVAFFLSQIIVAQTKDSVTYTKVDLSISAQKKDSLLLAIDQVEIASLNPNMAHKKFFKDIWDLHQGMQKTELKISYKFGYLSAEHDSILQVILELNSYLFDKTREYLSTHPYPQKDELGAFATKIPLLVFNQAATTSETIDLKKLYFPKFFKSYERGDIHSGDLWMMLYRLYAEIKGENYVNQELGDEGQIKEMIRLLELKTR